MSLFNPFIISTAAGIVLALACLLGVIALVRLGRVHTEKLKPIGSSILHFTWTKSLLYWIILSAGVMSDCVFLIASLWMSVNASVHPLVLAVVGFITKNDTSACQITGGHIVCVSISEQVATHISEMATTAYVVLPECILGLALVTTISHFRTWIYGKKQDWTALTWSVLHGLPTLVFLVLSLFTLANSVQTSDFALPPYLVVTRALAGYMFAMVSLLYAQLGKPQETDRLKEKDDRISELGEHGHVLSLQIEALHAELEQQKRVIESEKVEQARVNSLQIDTLKAELEGQKRATEEQKAARKQMLEEIQKSDDAALEGYGDSCINWLRSGIKTALPDEITRFTGISKRKIANAIASGNLQVSSRNKELVMVSSLILWLKNQPSPSGKTETPVLHIVNE